MGGQAVRVPGILASGRTVRAAWWFPLPDPDPPALFDIRPGPLGPVEQATRRTITAAVVAERLDVEADALLIAHLCAVAGAVDRCAARVDARAMTALSRELRAVVTDLGLGRAVPAVAAPAVGPFDFLTAAEAEAAAPLAP
jgi:hypothetical protein